MQIKFDIIIPYFNEEKIIYRTLNQLNNLIIKPNKIIFINSKSNDKSSNLLNEYIAQKKLINWENHDTDLRTPSEAKNFGIRKSNAEWCAFMDFDLYFDKYWTKNQLDKINTNNEYNIIFGVVNILPSKYFDKLVIAQTYGINSMSPVIPSSFIKREFFYANGFFMPYRSHYDRVFINSVLKNKNKYVINDKVKISYFNTAYANNIFELIVKVINYSIQIIYFPKTFFPYLYFLFSIFYLSLFFIDFSYFIFITLFYFLIRGIIIPIKKNNQVKTFIFKNFIPLFLVGFLIDISKSLGFIIGAYGKIFGKKIRLDNIYK